MTDIISRLSTSLDQRNEQPNIALGKEIARAKDRAAINEIRKLLTSGISTDLLCDLLKVLEAAGAHDPELIADLFDDLLALITRPPAGQVVWRSMCVLAWAAPLNRKQAFDHLGQLLDVMDRGSVVARDHGFNILTDLYNQPEYRDDLFPLIKEQILAAPDNQLGQYSEKWLKVIQKKHIPDLQSILETRQPELEKEAHRKRIGKILRQLYCKT